MLPSQFHAVVDEIGHTLEDVDSHLQLDTHRVRATTNSRK